MRALSVSRGMTVPTRLHATRRRAAVAPARPSISVTALTLSLVGHGVVVAALVAAILFAGRERPKVHVVNLASSIAAVGDPAGSEASLPARTLKPAPRAPEPDPAPRAREAAKAVEAALPSRAVMPRRGERDLPPLPTPSERRGKALIEPISRPSVAALGRATGSVSGQGPLTLDVTDFPYAWYLRQVLQKVEERWQAQSRSSESTEKPRIYVEIRRDGSIAPPRVEQTSGNSFYDRAALRAITEASPFPPLPADWANPSLRVLFNFDLKRG